MTTTTETLDQMLADMDVLLRAAARETIPGHVRAGYRQAIANLTADIKAEMAVAR